MFLARFKSIFCLQSIIYSINIYYRNFTIWDTYQVILLQRCLFITFAIFFVDIIMLFLHYLISNGKLEGLIIMIIKNKSIVYTECAEMLRRIRKNKSTLKTEVYKTESPRKYMAILSQVIKNSDKYSSIANDMEMTESNKDLCLIHVHEILNGNIRVKKDLKAKFDELKKKYECIENKEKVTYFRIINKDSEIDIEYQNTALEGVYKTIASLAKSQAYLNGDIIIQNYSSCLPAIVLNPENNSKIIDACAAPGNKSIHLSNLMKNTGKIFAYERDAERYETLRQMLSKYKCKNTKPVNKDFLETKSIKSIDYILVDPSCSGSGIHDLYSKCDSRVSKLAAFQKKILLHALSFENVKKVVYSTCSVHEEENEEVVKYALENNDKFCVEMIKLPGIANNGNQNYEFGDKVIRMDRDKNNNINGFFVALFVRK